MKMRWTMILLAALAAAPAAAQQKGDWVLARWQGGAYWFPGVVESRTGKSVTVAYDDGTRETRPLSDVRRFDWTVGSRVECRWAGGTEWYGGRITAMGADGVTMNVTYDDGDREQTRTAACRSS